MDKLEYYRNTIKQILTGYYEMTVKGAIALDELEPEHRLAFDEERDQYLWFRSGWNGKERLRHITIRTYAWESRNRVFLQKYFVATRRLGKKPGFFVGVNKSC